MNRSYSTLFGLALCLSFSSLAAQTPPTGLTATIPGSFSVSSSGAATYQIPIDLPSGAGGLTPQLSLSYNNLAGLGLAGQGWNLNGLSAITRVGKDIAHDGLAAPVTFTNQDPLVLDGNRMVVLSGAHLTAGAVYGTEQEGFAKIETVADGTTVWFKVTQKNGTVMEYGRTAGSRYTPTGAAAPYQWWLSRVTDTFGNTYEVSYDMASNQPVPTKVTYSKNLNTSAAGITVDFAYSSVFQPTTYQGGASFDHGKRLDNITVKVGANEARKYALSYESGLELAVQLNSVALNVNGVGLPKTDFVWEKASFQDTSIVATTLPRGIPNYGDFDGNGSTDAAKLSGSNLMVYRWSGSGFDGGSAIAALPIFAAIYTPDLNGDGLADLVGYSLKGTVPTCSIYQNTGMALVFKADVALPGYSHATNPLQLGDLNGDGKVDLVWAAGKVLNFWPFSDFTALFGGKATYTSAGGMLRDFNGDGKAEVLVGSGALLSYSSGAIVSTAVASTPLLPGFYSFTPGDFNGDGLCDLFYYDTKVKLWKIRLFDGKGFNGSMLVDIPPTGYYATFVADFDGDGADDIILQTGYPATLLTFFSPKTGAIFTKTVTNGSFYFDPENLADFDGDGGNDLLYSEGATTSILKVSDLTLPRRISRINRGDGFSYGVAYKSTRDANFCSHTFTTAYPLASFSAPQFLASKVTTPDGVGGSRSRSYSYANPKVHLGGLGYLGVEKFVETDDLTEATVTQTFELANARYEPHLVERNVMLGATPISTEAYAYEFKNLTLGRYFSYTSGVTSVDELKGVTTKGSNSYDDSGNLFYESKSSGEFSSSTTYSGFTGPATVAPSFPTSIQTRYLQGRGITREVNTTLTYTDKWKVLTQAQDGAPTKKFTYNSFGNVLSVEETGSSETRSTGFSYDPTGRFLTGTTNAKNQSASSVVNTETGTVTNSTDVNGFKTEYLYDALGRPTKVTGPDGNYVEYTYSWCAVGEAPNAVRKTDAKVDGAGTTTEWYDIFGRTVQKSSPAPNGRTVVVKYTYNEKGELLNQSLPGFTNPSSELVSFVYDAYGRVTRNDAPGKSTSYSYDNNSVTETNVVTKQSTTVTYNEVGLPVLSSGSNGIVSYTYNGLGQPVDVIADGKTITHYDYTYATNTQEVTNLNAGKSTVTSNVWGQPLDILDAKGNHTYFKYDELGRLQTKTLPEGAVTYTYDATLKGVLNQVTFGNHTRTYGYNATKYGRLESTTDNIGGRSFPRLFAYDDTNNGRLQAVTYPNGFVAKYGYDAYGFTATITKGDNSPIWEWGDENALGQPISYKLGNGLQQNFSYNTNDHTIESIGAAGVYSQSYKVNAATGNLEWRRDNRTPNLREDFTYDAADRLKTITGPQGNYTMNYSGDGNITQKTDAGDYNYLLPQPHAVSQIAPAANSALVPTLKQSVAYNSYNKPTTISQADGQNAIALTYGVDLQRVKEITYKSGAVVETRYLLGDYEVVVKPGMPDKHYCYVSSTYGVVAVNISEGMAAGSLHYLHTDFLGSVVAITDASKKVEQEMSYDAWGRRRNPVDWKYTGFDPSTYLINRGYTFHEHYDKLGLINMNGRVYDPIVGRFLSVDPVVSDPLSAQSYNGYSYCLNNPLKYTDPSGYTTAAMDASTSMFDWWSDFQNARKRGFGGSASNYLSQVDEQSVKPDFDGSVDLIDYIDHYSMVSTDNCQTYSNVTYTHTTVVVTKVKTDDPKGQGKQGKIREVGLGYIYTQEVLTDQKTKDYLKFVNKSYSYGSAGLGVSTSYYLRNLPTKVGIANGIVQALAGLALSEAFSDFCESYDNNGKGMGITITTMSTQSSLIGMLNNFTTITINATNKSWTISSVDMCLP